MGTNSIQRKRYYHQRPRENSGSFRFPSAAGVFLAFHDLSDAAIEVAQECPNITLIGSGVRAVNILKAIKILGAERVCFGSDTPFALMHVELAMYEALMRDQVTEQDRDLILSGNIKRLFGLED